MRHPTESRPLIEKADYEAAKLTLYVEHPNRKFLDQLNNLWVTPSEFNKLFEIIGLCAVIPISPSNDDPDIPEVNKPTVSVIFPLTGS